jgi:D-alanyl-D-alanine carboxypeptidase
VLGITVAVLTAGLLQAPTGHAAPGPTESDTRLAERLAAIKDAGVYGAYAAKRNDSHRWRGATGVADIETKRHTRPEMRHRIGDLTKTFTAVAILQQVAAGTVDLDAPVVEYLPELRADGLDPAVTVRMLLNHTGGIGDYKPAIFPSLEQGSPASIDKNRFRHFNPRELARIGLRQSTTGAPTEHASYSHTNYVIAGLVLEAVTGIDAGTYIAEHVIRTAGLRGTTFPTSPFVRGPHSRMYDTQYGLIDPPRDYSVYNMSYFWTAGAIISTMDDVNRFYAALFDGELIGRAELSEMLRTVPIADEHGNVYGRYGLGIYPIQLSCGTFWGHNGSVWGAGTAAYATVDGERQAAVGINRQGYHVRDEEGNVLPHPVDAAIEGYLSAALCDTQASTS